MSLEILIQQVHRVSASAIARILGSSDEVGRTYTLRVEDSHQSELLTFGRCKVVTSSADFGILHIPKLLEHFVPGYRQQFALYTDMYEETQPFLMHVTGKKNGDVQEGDIGGSYLCHPRPADVEERWLQEIPFADKRLEGSLLRYYEAHPELVDGTLVSLFRLDNCHYYLKAF